MFEFLFQFHWNMFLRVQFTIFQHWFRQRLVAFSAPSHYLNQCWPSSPTHICGTRGRWINSTSLIMMTSSNGNIFRVTGPLCGEFTGPGEFPAQRPVTRSFDVFFDLRPNKRLSKQAWGWWFKTPSWSLWRRCNVVGMHGTCCWWQSRETNADYTDPYSVIAPCI